MSNPNFIQNDSDEALLQLARAIRDTQYQFTTTTPATHERINKRPENRMSRDLIGVFGWSRLFQPDVLPPEIWQLMNDAEVVIRQDENWRSLVRLSSLNGQLYLHSAYPTTDADAVFFGPDTYRFARAIESYLKSNAREVKTAVDICCGAGPGAISIALARPGARVLGVDINEKALRFSRINAVLAGATNVDARHSDLLCDVKGSFDLIVANPPYLVDASERAYRHGGGPLGAGLSLSIVDAALQRLVPNGTLLLYTGVAMVDNCDPFLKEVQERLNRSNVSYAYAEIDPDVFGEELEGGAYAHADRIAAAVLEVTNT